METKVHLPSTIVERYRIIWRFCRINKGGCLHCYMTFPNVHQIQSLKVATSSFFQEFSSCLSQFLPMHTTSSFVPTFISEVWKPLFIKMVSRSVKDHYTDNGIFFFFLVIDKIFFGCWICFWFFLVYTFSLVATWDWNVH